MTQSTNLKGQTAVVTGAGRGIGREIARVFAEAGGNVAVTARTQHELDETVQLIESQDGRSAAFIMDVTHPEQVDSAFAAIRDQFGPIDVLVNNAGVGGEGVLPWEVDVDAWWRVMEVNVKGAFLCSRAALPQMIERRTGRIINIGSNVGLYAAPYASAYSVSKAALLRLTENLAEAAREFDISVFAISPGLVLTDMTRDVPFFQDLPASAWVPVERAGELCLFVASGQADQLTGRYIHVTEDDVREMVRRADEIVENDLNALRLQR